MMVPVYMSLVLLLAIQVQVQAFHPPSQCSTSAWNTQWSEGCDAYNVTEGVKPLMTQISAMFNVSALSECTSGCTGRGECGGFVIANSTTNYVCYLYNINDHIINQYLTDAVFENDDGWTWYSKTCQYDTGDTNLSCNVYSTTVPIDTYIGTSYMWAGSFNLTATHCKSFCTLSTRCKSTTYSRRISDGYTVCKLHHTTVEELRAAGQNGSVWVNGSPNMVYTNYNRLCAEGSPYDTPGCPTITNQATTTTTLATTTTTLATTTTNQATTTTNQATTTTNQATTTTTQAAPTPSSGIILMPISVCRIVSGLTVIMITMYLFPLH